MGFARLKDKAECSGASDSWRQKKTPRKANTERSHTKGERRNKECSTVRQEARHVQMVLVLPRKAPSVSHLKDNSQVSRLIVLLRVDLQLILQTGASSRGLAPTESGAHLTPRQCFHPLRERRREEDADYGDYGSVSLLPQCCLHAVSP